MATAETEAPPAAPPAAAKRSRRRSPAAARSTTADLFRCIDEKGLEQALVQFHLHGQETEMRHHVGQIRMARHGARQHEAAAAALRRQEALHTEAIEKLLAEAD